jgi:uncharacterized protein YbjT (DUF2867 family)
LDVVRILVAGATGYVGSRLVTALLAERHHVVVASRNPVRFKRFGWFQDVTSVTFDASDAASVRAVFARFGPVDGAFDVVYYLVHAIGQPGFRDADNAAAAVVAAAAKAAGVRRIVYLGGFAPNDETLSEHLAGRAEVAQALTVPDGPELVWLGAAIIIGAGSTSFEMMRYVGDALRIRRLARVVVPPMARPALGLVNLVPGPVAGALRTGLDLLLALTPKVRPA